TEDGVDRITGAPESGIYRMDADGRVRFHRFDHHRLAVESENEAYWLRISGPGDYRYEGADLGILITRGRSMTDDFTLNARAHHWIEGIKALYQAEPLAATAADDAPPAAGAFKLL
ncbi:MAG: hypothetical protein KDG55_20895, partial [Rhodocyclaceae bacterium]|nr:hypothetical protein [Rhodocyclaceae bacterium]